MGPTLFIGSHSVWFGSTLFIGSHSVRFGSTLFIGSNSVRFGSTLLIGSHSYRSPQLSESAPTTYKSIEKGFLFPAATVHQELLGFIKKNHISFWCYITIVRLLMEFVAYNRESTYSVT